MRTQEADEHALHTQVLILFGLLQLNPDFTADVVVAGVDRQLYFLAFLVLDFEVLLVGLLVKDDVDVDRALKAADEGSDCVLDMGMCTILRL